MGLAVEEMFKLEENSEEIMGVHHRGQKMENIKEKIGNQRMLGKGIANLSLAP
jgi:hypothetical protein